jgi:hypothetical protein
MVSPRSSVRRCRVTNWTTAPFPVAPWDSPGLPPRTITERCARHRHCAYRDDNSARCPLCHATLTKCQGDHGGGRYGTGVAGDTHPTLKAGQCNNPLHEAIRRTGASQPRAEAYELVGIETVRPATVFNVRLSMAGVG